MMERWADRSGCRSEKTRAERCMGLAEEGVIEGRLDEIMEKETKEEKKKG